MKETSDRGQRIAARAGQWVRQMVVAGLGLFVLALVTGNLGNLSRTLNGMLAVGGLLGLAILSPRSLAQVAWWRLVLALALLLGSLPIVASGEPLGPLGVSLFLFALSLLARQGDGTTTALLLTALLFALYRLFADYVPALWHVEHALAIYFSRSVGAGLMLGPTALGMPLLVLFVLYALSAFLLAAFPQPTSDERSAGGGRTAGSTGTRRRVVLVFAAWLLSLVLAVVAYVWLQPPLSSWLLAHWPRFPFVTAPIPTPTSPPALTHLESPSLLFMLLWLASSLAGLWVHPHPLSLAAPHRSGRWVAVGLALLACSTVVLTLDPSFQPRRGPILFYDTGHMEWGRPVFGRYGAQSGGTFGLWPDYLAAYGYEARIGRLTEENLEGARAVVLVNLPEILGQEEKDRLLAFVEEGGGLVIWGEHTGLGRIREPINDLLAAVPGAPIQLQFDSAVPSRQGWAEGLTLMPHPAVYGVQDPVDLVIAVGASLYIAPPARPVIVGRFGHSDAGNVADPARNYAGDMRYNPGEQLGDVVLAAEVQYGRGRIVVLGDTTPLGSVNLMTTMPFHARLLDWVTAERPEATSFLLRNGWLAALLLLGAGAFLLQGRSRITIAGAALVLILTLVLTARLNEARSAPPVPTGPIAYVDSSHQERFDRLLWEESSIGGLDYNLVRNGTLPLLLRKIDAEALSDADLLVIIAPGGSFSAREIGTITGWVEGGGRLLVSVGWEESEASQALLASFGLSVGHIPLGPVVVERGEGLVRFHEAWPVQAEGGGAQTIVEGYGYPLAVYQPWGKGGVILIGDSAFLLGGTLEGQTTYQEGNILLLRAIMQEYLGFGSPLTPFPVGTGTSGGEP